MSFGAIPMKFITELLKLTEQQQLSEMTQAFAGLEQQYAEILNVVEQHLLAEASDLRFADQAVSFEDIDEAMDRLQQMFIATRRGLGLVNQLTGESKSRHASRVMSNMNRIRNKINELIRLFGPTLGTVKSQARPGFLKPQAA